MVHFKNRYMVMEIFIDAGRGEPDPVILTQFNITKVIRDSIQLNFGECGLAASLGSLQGSIRACKTTALECDEAKFEQYKLTAGDHITPKIKSV
ncbi:hypothetical protein BAE44_0022977 [Dichanthelium oligosanthes]|uniref:Uncharacterized protein n=1 Tax=Dichanthelium oligosanthes TaxID=888268 RepID=A0A1E5UT54_9POAL|nr:hypothetical protein BAE44_0022977 [Dichanthelium oligosanthes]